MGASAVLCWRQLLKDAQRRKVTRKNARMLACRMHLAPIWRAWHAQAVRARRAGSMKSTLARLMSRGEFGKAVHAWRASAWESRAARTITQLRASLKEAERHVGELNSELRSARAAASSACMREERITELC